MPPPLQAAGVMEKATLSFPRYNNSYTWVCLLVSLSPHIQSEGGVFLLKAFTHFSFVHSDCPQPRIWQAKPSRYAHRRKTSESLRSSITEESSRIKCRALAQSSCDEPVWLPGLTLWVLVLGSHSWPHVQKGLMLCHHTS